MVHKRLTVVIPVRWPVGGIRSYLRSTYSRLSDLVARTIIVGPLNNNLQSLRSEIHGGIDVEIIESPPGTMPFCRSVWEILRRESIDLVHSQGYIAGASCAWSAARKHVPHVVTVHDVFQGPTARGPRAIASRAGLALSLRSVSVLHSVGDDVDKNVRDHLPFIAFKGPKLVSIRNGVETDRLVDAAVRPLRQELCLGSDTKLIGFLGRFMAQKGFRLLVEAVRILSQKSDLPPFKVVTFGDGGFFTQDQAWIQSLGLGHLFIHLPLVMDVGPTLKALDMVAIPSRWEACPLLPMEALACGVPIVGSDCIGMREVLRGSPSRLVRTGDISDLARGLEEELRNSTRNEAEAYQTQAAQLFSVDHATDNLRALFRSLTPPETDTMAAPR